MTTIELLDQLIARLPVLREQGVTHLTIDPSTGATSMLIAPRAPVQLMADPAGEAEKPKGDGGAASFVAASELGLRPDAPRPQPFRERLKATPQVK